LINGKVIGVVVDFGDSGSSDGFLYFSNLTGEFVNTQEKLTGVIRFHNYPNSKKVIQKKKLNYGKYYFTKKVKNNQL
jgi:hypothetical protein